MMARRILPTDISPIAARRTARPLGGIKTARPPPPRIGPKIIDL